MVAKLHRTILTNDDIVLVGEIINMGGDLQQGSIGILLSMHVT